MTSSIVGASVFEGFYEAVAKLLGLLYDLTGSYGGAIILLTILVMLVTAPLTLKSTRSMLQMQRHQPELKRLQAQYKDDRERLNTEMMAFYKENGINPLSGCVPVLMQAPIFIILYQVLRGITTRSGGSASGIGRVAGLDVTGSEFAPWKLHDQVFSPQHLAAGTDLYDSLHRSTKMSFFGVDLAISPLDAVRIGIGTAAPFLALMVLMFVLQWYQNRQIQGRNTGAAVNPQQQMIMKVMPFFLPIFSFQFPAGLGLYYTVQGMCRIGLQGYITRAVYGPHHASIKDGDKPIDATSADATSKGKKNDVKNDKSATTGVQSGGAKSGQSARSIAAQQKRDGTAPARAGRKSGDPRASGRSRPNSGPADSKRG